MTLSISKMVMEIFNDGEKHVLQDIYTKVETAYKEENQEIHLNKLKHRIRSRINGLHSSGVIKRIGPSTYQINP